MENFLIVMEFIFSWGWTFMSIEAFDLGFTFGDMLIGFILFDILIFVIYHSFLGGVPSSGFKTDKKAHRDDDQEVF